MVSREGQSSGGEGPRRERRTTAGSAQNSHPTPDAPANTGDLRELVEEYGLLFEGFGHSRSEGRILGWLLMCHPPEQSMAEISEALDMSKGGVSVALRQLVDRGLVQRRRRPGVRHDSFRFDPESIGTLMENLFAAQMLVEELLSRSRRLPGQEDNDRLAAMHALYRRLTEEMPALLERWRADARLEARSTKQEED